VTDEALKAAYLATEVFVDLDGSNSLEHCIDASEAAGRLGTLFVLTAHNPASEVRSDAENDAQNAALEADIVALGATFHPAIGRSPDGSWFEPGFALVGVDLATATRLGSDYGQSAIFEVHSDRVIVQACDGSYRLERRA
jgi:hypothetical protein